VGFVVERYWEDFKVDVEFGCWGHIVEFRLASSLHCIQADESKRNFEPVEVDGL
jgi:hypothetical protein